MPKAPPKAPPKGGSAKGAGLKKKLGPLPLWAWVAIAGGGVAVWYFFIRGSGGGGTFEEGAPSIVSGSGAASPQQQASAGAPSQNGSMASQLDPTTLDALANAQADIGDVRGHVTELEDALSRAGFSANADKSWSYGGDTGGDVTGVSLDDRIRSIIDSMGGVQKSPGSAPKGTATGKHPSTKHPTKSTPKHTPKPAKKPTTKKPPAAKHPVRQPVKKQAPKKQPAKKVPVHKQPAPKAQPTGAHGGRFGVR